MRERRTSKPVGERRLADPLPAADEPCMVHAAVAEQLCEDAFGRLVPEQFLRLPRMREAFEPVRLRQLVDLHGGGGARHQRAPTRRRDCTACHTAADTLLSSVVASISTQRFGSARAIAVNASRSRQWKARSRFS